MKRIPLQAIPVDSTTDKDQLESMADDAPHRKSSTITIKPAAAPRRRSQVRLPPSMTSERRGSLPALHLQPVHATDVVVPRRKDSIGDDIYGGLQSFTFGAPAQYPVSVDEYDEEDLRRRDRAKMRAIDDGTRRPSLPTNAAGLRRVPSISSLTTSISSHGIVVGERQWGPPMVEPDWDTPDIVMADGEGTPTDVSYERFSDNDVRRQSLPIVIPGSNGIRRRSRSNDELSRDIARVETEEGLSRSQPLYGDDTSAESVTPSPVEENALDGFDVNFIFQSAPEGNNLSHNAKTASSNRLRSKTKKQDRSVARAEDTFMGHLGVFDPIYERRKREWSFRRELKGIRNGDDETADAHDVWRCDLVGRFVVKKHRSSKASNPSQTGDVVAPLYDRIQVSPAVDLSCKGNPDGGPRILIHRHSRARAFSLFRAYSLPRKVMPPNASVLMGILSVLTQYTRTESTRQLRTHGLTDEKNEQHSRPRREHTSERSEPKRSSNSSARSSKSTRDGEQDDTSSKVRKNSSRPSTASSSRPSSVAMSSAASTSTVTAAPPLPQPGIVAATKPTDNAIAPRPSTSHYEAFAMLDAKEYNDQASQKDRRLDDDGYTRPSPGASRPPQPLPPHVAPLPPAASPPRTALETFGDRLKRAFGAREKDKGAVSPPGGTHARGHSPPSGANGRQEPEDDGASKPQDSTFAPPWMTVAPRSQREQHERMIRTLNDSFESVGLIPPRDKKSSRNGSRRGDKERKVDGPLGEIPEESMAMLLPLWEGRTLSDGSVSPEGNPSLEDRKFLLVYFSPFEAESDPPSWAREGNGNTRKRRRAATGGDQHAGASHSPSHSLHVNQNGERRSTTSFRVVARVLSYDDVKCSNARLPDKGLAVTQDPQAEWNPVPYAQQRTLNWSIIAICYGAENGVELVQEGLDKLGLMDPTVEKRYDANGDVTNARLSKLGRAVAEMVWTGCLSLMVLQ